MLFSLLLMAALLIISFIQVGGELWVQVGVW